MDNWEIIEIEANTGFVTARALKGKGDELKRLTLRFLDDFRPKVVGLQLQGDHITGVDLKEIRLPALTKSVYDQLGGAVHTAPGNGEHVPQHVKDQWPRNKTSELAKWIAAVYLNAVETDEPPTVAVADAFGASRATGARMVSFAREQGELGNARPGQTSVSKQVFAGKAIKTQVPRDYIESLGAEETTHRNNLKQIRNAATNRAELIEALGQETLRHLEVLDGLNVEEAIDNGKKKASNG